MWGFFQSVLKGTAEACFVRGGGYFHNLGSTTVKATWFLGRMSAAARAPPTFDRAKMCKVIQRDGRQQIKKPNGDEHIGEVTRGHHHRLPKHDTDRDPIRYQCLVLSPAARGRTRFLKPPWV